ncbi:hypothetical protein HWV62_32226 [Athelia sp. TMB]|nr:hypothetical protein HWV62_32226 [Athelia sp. TMB]
MLLAKPLHPLSFSTKDVSEGSGQYRSSQEFKSLLAPIEFVEGSSSGGLAVPEGKYEPINGTPKAKTAMKKDTAKDGQNSRPNLLTSKRTLPLYNGTLNLIWPTGTSIGSGLYNNGNTCFLNSALQCLLHTAPLLHVLLGHKTEQSIAKHMRKGRQEDSHEFLRYAIDALQKSCLAGMPSKLDPKLAETTWVHKIFGGRLRSRVSCRECHYNSDTFDSILDLSLDIIRQTSLKEVLHNFVKIDTLKGADKYKCEKCKKPVVAEKNFTIHDAPTVLTIHLKRFSPLGRKISHPIHYDERLSLQAVMSEGQFGPTYSLYGVISHAGSGPNSGHYYAHVKGANGHWYEMNDESVTSASKPTGLRNAYILFYVREKGQSLQAAVNQVPTPSKNGVAAAMKKRKGGEHDQEDTGVSTTRPFIGPVLPSLPATSLSPCAKAVDPQGEALKRKIAAAAQVKATQAMRVLSQYGDDGDSDMDVSPEELPSSSAVGTPHNPRSSPTANPPVTSPVASSPVSPSIPASSFYTNGKEKGKKRKSPDGEPDEYLHRDSRSPRGSLGHRTDNQSRRLKYTGNPYNRISGPSAPQRKLNTYGHGSKRRRGFAV